MMRLASQHSEAASIASQGLRLRSVLAAHQLHITDKLNLCQQSVEYAKLANDSNAMVAAIVELAVAYKYADQPEKSLRTYQEALYHIDDHVSPLIQSRAYAAAAAAFAQAKRKREAGFYIGLAHEVFPAYPEQDPVAPLADYGSYMLIYYSGLVHIESNEGKQAWNTFEGVKNLQIVVPERNRLEIVNYQGKAAIQANDLDGYSFCLEDGLASSVMLKSMKRFDEAANIMKRDMPAPWLNDRRIQDIIEKYHLDVAS